MTQTNSSILRGYFDEVVNQKYLDLLSRYLDLYPKYFSEKFIGHVPLYVSMGIMSDDSSGVKIIIQSVAPGSPAAGKLMIGDEILHVFDGARAWLTFDELRGGVWGQGAFGTTITIWVLRENVEHEITLTRGLVQGLEFPYHLHVPSILEYFKDWRDLKVRLVNVLEIGDLVAYHAEIYGHNVRYGRSAMWAEFGFVRIQDGKITDWWSEEDKLSQFKQLGYTIQEPALAKK
jgi:hypothetical protein